MTMRPSPIRDMLEEALRPGPVIEPAALLAALESEASPLDAVTHIDGPGTVSAAIEQDFGQLRSLGMRPDVAETEIIAQGAALLRWLLSTIKCWKLSEDPKMRVLAAALVTSRRCGGNANIWRLLNDDQAPSAEFLVTARVFVARRQMVLGARGGVVPPIWESEFAEAFQAADAGHDWNAIANMWPRFGQIGSFDILFIEMVRCLAHYDFAALVLAADALNQCPPLLELAQIILTDQRLRLAIASGSNRVGFCCAFVTVAKSTGSGKLSPAEEAALSELLTKVADTPEEWRKWMVTFNTYPLRYPLFHRPLGHALARVSPEAAAIYIDSIRLDPNGVTHVDESRCLVSDCLRIFGAEASAELRQAVWAHAYRRWRDWHFDTATPGGNLLEPSRSALDFAVTSYVCECMSTAERDGVVAEIQSQLGKLELSWYRSETDCTTEWNRMLSLFQPYAHSYRVAEAGADILNDNGIYYPFDLSASLYHRIMFRVPQRLAPAVRD